MDILLDQCLNFHHKNHITHISIILIFCGWPIKKKLQEVTDGIACEATTYFIAI